MYLVKDARINGKKIHLFQKYLGPESRIKDMEISSIFKKHANKVECETLEFGISAALWQIADDIDLVGMINEVIGKSTQEGHTLGEYLTIAAINRCAEPCSKSMLGQWFEREWLATKFKVEPKTLNAQTYWNHFQNLDKMKIREIEQKIIQKVVSKYKLGVNTVLYDPTNFFTFSRGGRGWQEGNGSELLMFGHSKENRNGNRLVAFWLLCERDSGVPIMHETYAGNRQDAGIFQGLAEGEPEESVPLLVAQRLKSLGVNLQHVTMVFDNGNLSLDGIKAIEKVNLGFIASRRPSEHKKILLHLPMEEFTETILPATGKKILYYKTTQTIYGSKRVVYATFDPAKHKKDVIRFRRKLDAKQAEIIEYFKDRVDFAPGETRRGQGEKWRMHSEVEKKVKAMIGRNPFKDVIFAEVIGPTMIQVDIGGRFDIYVSVNEKAQANHEETLGRGVIFTNRSNWTPEAVIWGYREQYVVEHAFRQMKCPDAIAIRPMYHHADPCIRGHIFSCVLAHLLLSLLRLKLRRKKILSTYRKILDTLRGIRITKIILSPKGKSLLKLNKVQGFAAQIVKHLGLKRLVTF